MRLAGFCWGHIGNVRRAWNKFVGRTRPSNSAPRSGRRALQAIPMACWMAAGCWDWRHLCGRISADTRRHCACCMRPLRVATKKEQPYLKLNHGFVLEQMGDPQAAIRVLQAAAQRYATSPYVLPAFTT